MTMINKDYLYTTIWTDLSIVNLEENSLYLYAHDPEERSRYCANELQKHNSNISFVELNLNDQDQASIMGSGDSFSLSSKRAVIGFIQKFNPTTIYLEVTGMSCRLIAPILRYVIEAKMQIKVIYSEPSQYRLPEFKKVGVNKDLSETVDGINPLPGFVTLVHSRKEPIFVVMLGFEGGRFNYLACILHTLDVGTSASTY